MYRLKKVETNMDNELKTTFRKNLKVICEKEILPSFQKTTKDFDVSDDVAICTSEDKNIELDLQIEKMIEKNEGIWQCKVCGNTCSARRDIKEHAETHIESVTHSCHVCNKTFANRNSLRCHIRDIHSELFSCNICGKSGMNRKANYKHKRECENQIMHFC